MACQKFRCMAPKRSEDHRMANTTEPFESKPLSMVPLIMNSSKSGANMATETMVSTGLVEMLSNISLKLSGIGK